MAKPDCVAKVAEKLKLGQFETEKLRELEAVIHDLMDYYDDPKTKQVDRASIQKEFEKVLEDWKVDTKTEAADTIANRIKEERARRAPILAPFLFRHVAHRHSCCAPKVSQLAILPD